MDPRYDVLVDASRLAHEFVQSLPERRVVSAESVEDLRARIGLPLSDSGEDPRVVIEELARDADAGLTASAGPRYYGLVIGGALPVAVAADWLASAWDQNAGGYLGAPAISVVEETAGKWVRELLGLPISCGIGFVTGCQMAHVTCLAAARHSLLRRVGWDVDALGLEKAPHIRVVAGAQVHVTVRVACRLLGLGFDCIRTVPCDDEGRVRVDELDAELAQDRSLTIVCAQAGEVNTGAFDPLEAIVDICEARGAWCHVDGAFGLWAAASQTRRHLVAGIERAHSWATDAHKWLNVPYDCGIAAVADASAQRAAMGSTSAYIPDHDDDLPWGSDWTPEFSRRARGLPLYAVLRSLGRRGVADLIDRCCDHAQYLASRLAEIDGIEVLNEVVLNQVMVRFADDDAITRAAIEGVQVEGTCWLSGSTFLGKAVMRVSLVGWQTTREDVARAADAIIRVARGQVSPQHS